jgi:iron complex outermembrane receptor protein
MRRRRFRFPSPSIALAFTLSLGASSAWGQAPSPTATAPLTTPKLTIDPAETEADKALNDIQRLMDIQVTTLSRVDERIDEAPGSIYAFDRDKITTRGYRSLGQLLQTVPGFTVFHRDLDYVAGVRGLNANDNEKISLLINGQNVNGMNEPDFLSGPINLDNAKRVEVVVGPSSLFQQANTLAATVNVLTRDVEGVVVDAGAGNALRYSTTVMAGHQWNEDHNFTVSLTTEDIRGYDAYDRAFRPLLADRNLVGELEQPNYFAVAKGQNGELFGQFIAYRTTFPELSIDSGSLANDGKMVDEFYTGYLRLEHPFASDLMAIISADVNYKRQSRQNDNGLPVEALQQYLSQVTFETDWSLQYTGIKNNLLQVGIQASFDDNLDNWYTQNTVDLTIPRTILIDRDTYAAGFYLDEEYRLTDYLKLVGGFRFDRNSRLEPNRLYPGFRAGVILEPTKTWVSKVTFNRAVRFPSALAALNDAWGIGKPDAPDWAALAPNATQPETLSTIEWTNIVYLDQARLSLTLYHEELMNFISWFGPHTNVGNFFGNGVELSIDYPITKNLSVWANTSYNNSKLVPFAQYAEPTSSFETHHVLTDTNGHIIGAPQVTANAGLEYEFLKDVTIAPTLRYFTEQAGFDDQTNTFQTFRNKFYLDATLTWKNLFEKHMDLHFSVENLLNNRSEIGGQWLRGAYAPRGMTFVISAEVRF